MPAVRLRLPLLVAFAALAFAGGASGRAGKIGGIIHNRVEYTYIDKTGWVVGAKIYECSGWVLKWGDTSEFVDVKITPCD